MDTKELAELAKLCGKSTSVYIVPIFTLIGIIAGVALAHFSTGYLAKQQRRSELRQESYATLLALRVPWCAAVTHLAVTNLKFEVYKDAVLSGNEAIF